MHTTLWDPRVEKLIFTVCTVSPLADNYVVIQVHKIFLCLITFCCITASNFHNLLCAYQNQLLISEIFICRIGSASPSSESELEKNCLRTLCSCKHTSNNSQRKLCLCQISGNNSPSVLGSKSQYQPGIYQLGRFGTIRRDYHYILVRRSGASLVHLFVQVRRIVPVRSACTSTTKQVDLHTRLFLHGLQYHQCC